MPAVIATLMALSLLLVFVWSKWRRAARAEFIRGYSFPIGLFEKLRAKRPELTQKDCQLVAHGLRQFFLAHLKSRQFVSMPSQVADELWHELILHTRAYQQFCDRAFGRFMHHTPAVVLGSVSNSNAGLRRCWWFCCREENINLRQPTRLPLLFALDSKLNIQDGFHYLADCKGIRRTQADGAGVVYCGGDFSSDSVDGSTDGFGDGVSGSSSDGGDGGGGCGGGGD